MLKTFGSSILNMLAEFGAFTLFSGRVLKSVLLNKLHSVNTLSQMVQLGLRSLPIVMVTSIFTGMVFAVQIMQEFIRFGAAGIVGGVMGLALWRELVPILIGVVGAGRIGAAVAAELGSMKVTEQIEALEALSQDPIQYLVVPRLLAVTIMLPLMVGLADIISFFSGFVICVGSGKINPSAYIESAQNMLVPVDIYGGILKAAVFGMIIALVACYAGLTTKAGARGVGISTTQAVVVSSVCIFVTNYFLSIVIF